MLEDPQSIPSVLDMAMLLPAADGARAADCTCVDARPQQAVLVFHFQRHALEPARAATRVRTRVPTQVQPALRITVRMRNYDVSGYIVRLSHGDVVGHTYSLVRRGHTWFVVDDADVVPISWDDVQRTCLGGICTPADKFVPSCSDHAGQAYCVHSAYYVCQVDGVPVPAASAETDPLRPLVVEATPLDLTPGQCSSEALPAVAAPAALVDTAALAEVTAQAVAPVGRLLAFRDKWLLAGNPLVLWLVSRATSELLSESSALSGQKRARSGATPRISQGIVEELRSLVSDLIVLLAALGVQPAKHLDEAVGAFFDMDGEAFSRALLRRVSSSFYGSVTTLDVKEEAGSTCDAGGVVSTRPVELKGATALAPSAPFALEVCLGVLSSCTPASDARNAFVNHVTVRVGRCCLVFESFR